MNIKHWLNIILFTFLIVTLVGCGSEGGGGGNGGGGETGIDEATFAEILNTQEEATQYFEGLRQTYGDEQARQTIVEWLLSQSNIQNAGISTDSSNVWIEYTAGIAGSLIGNPAGTRGTSSYAAGLIDISSPTRTVTLRNLADVSSQTAIILSPFDSEFSQDGGVESDYIANKLTQSGYSVESGQTIKDSNVTVDQIKAVFQYGVTVIISHGYVNKDGQKLYFLLEKRLHSQIVRNICLIYKQAV
jgi:hypothetical protein